MSNGLYLPYMEAASQQRSNEDLIISGLDAFTWLDLGIAETFGAYGSVHDQFSGVLSGSGDDGAQCGIIANYGTGLNLTDRDTDAPDYEWQTSRLNSRPSIKFEDGNTDQGMWNTTTLNSSQPFTIFLFGATDLSQVTAGHQRYLLDSNQTTNRTFLSRDDTGSIYLWADSGSGLHHDNAGGTDRSTEEAFGLAIVVNAGSTKFWLNGEEYDFTAFTGTKGMSNPTIGADYNRSASNVYDTDYWWSFYGRVAGDQSGTAGFERLYLALGKHYGTHTSLTGL